MEEKLNIFKNEIKELNKQAEKDKKVMESIEEMINTLPIRNMKIMMKRL